MLKTLVSKIFFFKTIFSRIAPYRAWIALACILVLALILRVALVPYGLPFLVHEDESIYLTKIMAFGYGDFSPEYFKKPTFFLYFHFAFFYLQYFLGTLMGGVSSWANFEADFWQDPSSPLIFARSITVCFSVASVALVYLIGKRVFSTVVGLGAAFLLAVNPSHVKFTPILIADIPAVFFILLTCWFALEIYEKGRLRDYLFCALAIGLTMSFKYNFFSAGFLAVAHLLRSWPKNTPILQSLKTVVLDRKPWLALLSAGLVFVALSPYIVLDFGQFYEHFTFEKDHVLQRTMGLERTAKAFVSFPKLLFKIMPRDAGWVLHVFNLLGILLIGLSIRFKGLIKGLISSDYDWKKGVILISFPIIFFLVIAQFRLVNAKYLLPITPFLMLLGALFISWAVQGFKSLLEARKTPVNALTFVFIATFYVMNLAFFLLAVQPLALKTLASVSGQFTSSHILHVTEKQIRSVLKNGDRLLLEKFTFPARSFSMLEKHFEGITLLQMGEPETTVETIKQFQPDYILINPKSIKDGDGYPMLRFPPEYYAYLQNHFETVGILTTYGIEASIDYPKDNSAEDYLALYQAVNRYKKTNKKSSQSPGPVLLLLKKIR